MSGDDVAFRSGTAPGTGPVSIVLWAAGAYVHIRTEEKVMDETLIAVSSLGGTMLVAVGIIVPRSRWDERRRPGR